MSINIHCLNNISSVGLGLLPDNYNTDAALEEANAILVRSAKIHGIS